MRQACVTVEHFLNVTVEMRAKLEESNRLNREYLDHIEWAWGIIANAGPEGCMGNWPKMDKEWVTIAERWRDKYHEILSKREKPKDELGVERCARPGCGKTRESHLNREIDYIACEDFLEKREGRS